MTISIVTDGFPPQVGGIATFNKHLATLLLSEGHKVVVILIDYDAQRDQQDEVVVENGITKVLLRKTYFTFLEQWQPYFRPGGFNAPNWIAIGLAVREWLLNNYKQYAIDVLEVSDYGGCGIFLMDKRLPPVVLTGHGSLLQYSRYNFTEPGDNYTVVRKLEELSFQHADAVIAHSLLNQQDLEQLFHRPIELALIPWLCEPQPLNDEIEKGKLVAVGGMQPIKGIYDMIDAMTLLAEQHPAIRLNWIGGDTWFAPGQGKMSTWLERQYPSVWNKTFCWKNEYDFERTRKEIATASLIIIPSFFETFNYVALEAAAMKKAILITDRTGAAAHFTHGHDAWIVEANKPVQLAEAIVLLQENETLSKQLGENAAVTVNNIFHKKQIVQQRMDIYNRSILKRKTSLIEETNELAFLYTYRTSKRKFYYKLRSRLKKIVGRK